MSSSHLGIHRLPFDHTGPKCFKSENFLTTADLADRLDNSNSKKFDRMFNFKTRDMGTQEDRLQHPIQSLHCASLNAALVTRAEDRENHTRLYRYKGREEIDSEILLTRI